MEGLIRGVAFSSMIMDGEASAALKKQKRNELGVDCFGFSPIKVTVEIGSFIPALYNAIKNGQMLTDVVFYWTTVNDKTHKEHIYMQQRIFPVKISKVGMSFPNVKDSRYQGIPHFADIWFRYNWLETIFIAGHYITKVEWPRFYSMGMSEKDAREFEKMIKGDALTDNLEIPDNKESIAKTGIWAPRWVHKDEELKTNSPTELAEGETIELSCDIDGQNEGASVQFEICYKEPKGNPIQFASAGTKVKNGTATSAWTVDLSRLKKKKLTDYKLSFLASYYSKPSSSVELVLRDTSKLKIERYYHDNEPVQDAAFEIELEDGATVNGQLDKNGKAAIGVAQSNPLRIRFQPDARDFCPVNQEKNTEYKKSFSQADVDAIIDNFTNKKALPPGKKSLVLDSIQWVCGTLQGSFSQKQSTSQIIVDAIIGMIPVVGDVTAVRDIIAVTIGLSLEEAKRKDKFQWLTIVLLLFALIPVIGGAIKGIGRLLLKGGKDASHIADFVAALNRIGVGDSVKFFKNLDLTKHTTDLLGEWRELLHRVDTVISTAKAKIGNLLPKTFFERLEQIRKGLATLKIEGEKMIPESVKELQSKLRAIQDQIYKGEWNEIPKTLKSNTREVEARLVETVDGGNKWVVERKEFPPSTPDDVTPTKKWPKLMQGPLATDKEGKFTFWAIRAFHGPIRPVKLTEGTTIYRILDVTNPESLPTGSWWTRELPKNGVVWRKDWAVLQDWSKNGVYVEYTLGKGEELYVWEGKVSSQLQNENTEKKVAQYLGGGETQLLIDFKHVINSKLAPKMMSLPQIPTNWGDSHLGVNLLPNELKVQKLEAQEIAPKGNSKMVQQNLNIK